MRIFGLTRRRDSCFVYRLMLPFSHLNACGWKCEDELMEQQLFCASCSQAGTPSGPYDIQWDQPPVCPICGSEMMDRTAYEMWIHRIHEEMSLADIVLFQRPTDLSHIRLIRKAKEYGKKTVQVADDLYTDVPEWNTGYEYYRTRKAIVEESLRIVDAIDVTTPALMEAFRPYNKDIVILPNSLDLELVDMVPPSDDFNVFGRDGKRLEVSQFWEMRSTKKFILWGGSPTHERDLELIVSAVRRLSRSEDVCFAFVGYVHRAMMEVVPKGRLFLFGLVPHSTYFSLYKGLKIDVGLAPVVENNFNKGKSNLKAIEQMAIRSLPVMSDFDTYRGCSPAGFYAQNDEYSWFKTMREAIHCDDAEERKTINRKFVEDNYDIKNTVQLWKDFYMRLLR